MNFYYVRMHIGPSLSSNFRVRAPSIITFFCSAWVCTKEAEHYVAMETDFDWIVRTTIVLVLQK